MGAFLCFRGPRQRLTHSPAIEIEMKKEPIRRCDKNSMEFNLLCVIVGIVTLVIGVFVGIAIRKSVAEKKIFGAEEEAKRILNEAIKNAENK